MTLLEINLTDVLSETDPDDKVVVWAPVLREGPAGQLVGTRRKAIPLTDGVGSDEVVPGPLMVQVQCKAMRDARPREVVVPEEGPVTLTALMDGAGAFTYSPAVVGQVAQYRNEAIQAAADAETAATTAGEHATQTADDRRQTGEDRTATGQDRVQTGLDRQAAETARDQAQAAAVRTPRILIHTGAGDPVLTDFPDAQVGDLIERVSDGSRWERTGGGVTAIANPVKTYKSGLRMLTGSDFLPGWGSYNVANYTLKIWRVGDNIHGGGYLTFSGEDAPNQRNIFTLPAGWRPSGAGMAIPVYRVNGTSAGRIDIDPNTGIARLSAAPDKTGFFIPGFTYHTIPSLPSIMPGIPT